MPVDIYAAILHAYFSSSSSSDGGGINKGRGQAGDETVMPP